MEYMAFLPLAVTLAIALWEHFRKEPAGRWHRIIVPALFILSFGASCALTLASIRAARRSAVETKDARDASATQMARIEGRLGSDEMAARYVASVRTLTQQYASENTAAAAKTFFETGDDRKKRLAGVEEVTLHVLTINLMKLQPIQDFIAAKMDTWGSELKTRKFAVVAQPGTVRPAQIGGTNGTWLPFFTLKFANGVELRACTMPAIVERGQLASPYNMRMILHDSKGDDGCWQLVVDESHVQLFNHHKPRFSFPELNDLTDDPMSSKQFIAATSAAVDQVIGYTIDERIR